MHNTFTYDLKIVYVDMIVNFLFQIVDKKQVIYSGLEAVMFRHDS
jgi:hypothetical protein